MVEVEPEKVEDAEFKWGKKKGIGGKKKRVQFYESFTYDGVEYVLFDSVYLYKEGEPEPYIGKLLKIWEHSDKMRKVKVLWFFRPCEILNFLGDEEPSDNELFLASGEGVGLCNVNPLVSEYINMLILTGNMLKGSMGVASKSIVVISFVNVGHMCVFHNVMQCNDLIYFYNSTIRL